MAGDDLFSGAAEERLAADTPARDSPAAFEGFRAATLVATVVAWPGAEHGISKIGASSLS